MPTVHFFCVLCGNALQTSSDSHDDLSRCPRCSRSVPVPKLVDGREDSSVYPPVFPPEVLELLVKFRCTACQAALYADARYEGREVVCSHCGAHPGIPRWSNMPNWPRVAGGSGIPRTPAPRLPIRAEAPTLSVEEIDFLRGTEAGKPGAAA